MKSLSRFVLALSVLVPLTLSLGACGNFSAHSEVEALNEAQAVGSPFTQNLASEYRDFANTEMNREMDYPDAIHFARKGLAAAAGEVVMPEPISDWNLLPKHMEELGAARGRLIIAFDLGARELFPKETAVAQARFDCWIEQQEENWQAKDIAGCKSQFLDAMGQLESKLPPAQAAVAEVVPAPTEPAALPPEATPMTPEQAMYLVFFDFNSSTIGAGAQNVLDAVAAEVGKRHPAAIHIVGHTDASGSKSYNNKLSMKRANAVRDALASRGIDASMFQIESRGEDDLLVQTADGVREPANRRAQINFQ